MTPRLEPNRYSPFADADPKYRHILPSPVFFPAAAPGVLAPTACEYLAVVPDGLSEIPTGENTLPDGLCPTCVGVMRRTWKPVRGPVVQCQVCESDTRHECLCSLCRMSQHDEWWPTRNTAVISAPELVGLDLVLSEMPIGGTIEVRKQTGPMHPGVWVIDRFENPQHATACVRRLPDEADGTPSASPVPASDQAAT